MNLVGPRPHPVTNRELFARNIPYYELRTLVRPGLTGWAQVHYGYANGLEEETEKMCYDLYYLKHRSLWLDLSVLPATVRVALAGSGGGETGETVDPAETAIIRQPGRQP
jgi:lipopolysaccharide/colanic/teichoic acid biosynthesis glycosyltransferase